jgi:hypothetical protein
MNDFLYILGILILVALSVLLASKGISAVSLFSERCDHQWTLIKNAELIKYSRLGKEVPYGYIRVHECEKCKKLKKQQIEMN